MIGTVQARATRIARADPRSLEFNSAALVLSGLVNGALGLVFWATAARLFPEAEVGRGAAIINTAVMLGALSNLSLGPMYERFLPASGFLARRFVLRGQLATGCLAFAVGVLFLLVGPSDRLFDRAVDAAVFPLCVMILSAFALYDSVLIGLRGGRWTAAKNVFHAVAKLLALVGLGFASGLTGSPSMLLAWMVPAVIAVVAVQIAVLLLGKGMPPRGADSAPRLPRTRELWAYFGGAYGITVIAAITPLVLPLVVVATSGHEATAYFSIAWSVVAAILMATGMVTSPFIAEVAAAPHQLAGLLRRFLRLYALVNVCAALTLAVVGPVALWVVGPTYAENATSLLRLMAVAQVLAVPGTVFGVLCRVHRELRFAVVMQVFSTAGIVGLSLLAVPRWGIDGVGYAFVLVELLVAAGVAVPLARRLRTDLTARAFDTDRGWST